MLKAPDAPNVCPVDPFCGTYSHSMTEYMLYNKTIILVI
ncbi:hypothetical protein RINTHM_1940 [Richelia intracellularis HM01]|nr:hypothetical protein RINTHM_1940 [Richelia intracellularis HM01]